MKQGMVQFVETYIAGDAPMEDALVGATELRFEDAADFDEDGGQLNINGVIVPYVSADLDEDILYLEAPLTFAVTVHDMVLVHPEASETVATCVDQDGSLDVIVPYGMRAFLPDGPRDIEGGEIVVIADDEYGRPTVQDVAGKEPAMDAHFVSNASELLLENERYLGEVLAANEAATTEAAGRLSAAEGRLDNAFSEIELKPDQGYVDAAKQQAIDAAAIDAQEKADAAKAASLPRVSVGANSKTFRNPLTISITSSTRQILIRTPLTVAAAVSQFKYVLSGTSSYAGDAEIGFEVAHACFGDTLPFLNPSMTNVGTFPVEVTMARETATGRLCMILSSTTSFSHSVISVDAVTVSNHPEALDSWIDGWSSAETFDMADFENVTEVTDVRDFDRDSAARAATAKAEAIDAAADDAAAKASAAQEAAEQAAQDALEQAQTDLQTAIASGDADAIADAEAKIATAKSEAIAAAANDATAKAGEAMQKANAALTAAQSAQATADNAIRTYYSETPPWESGTTQPDDVLGDMWYRDSTGQAYRWNGTSWKVIQDASIGEALAAAANAQTTADGKITAFYQPNEPLEADEGDLWFDTDNGSAIHRRTGNQWAALLDPKALADAAEQAAKTAAAADATAKAEAAEAAAAATAAADATEKANQAKADAEAAAQEYADTVAAGEGSGALAAAKEYAEQKAAEAQSAAEAAAAADATAKAEAAEAAAAATAAADATEKADAAQAAAIAAAEAAEQRALSRGTDLVTNGTGYLRSNYNWEPLTFTAADAPTGSIGSFLGTPGVYTQPRSTELIPVDPTKTYKLSASARQTGPADSGTLSMLYTTYDSAGEEIRLRHYRFEPGSTTTLAAPLNPGDTKISLTDSANWIDSSVGAHRRMAIFWDYEDPFGKVWPAETYSRNNTGRDAWAIGAIDRTTHEITLRDPWAGPAKPAGTKLSSGNDTTAYIYLGWQDVLVPTEWSQRSEMISGTAKPEVGNAISPSNGFSFPPGTASLQIGFLLNRYPDGASNIAVSGISLSDASAAQDMAADAKAYATERTDGLAKTLWSTSLPGTTTAPQNSVWYQVDGDEKIIAVFTQTAAGSAGNTWVARPIRSEAIDNLDVGKLTAVEGVVNDLVAQTFATKLADIIEANIGNLTVTGDTHLEDLVAQTIAGDTASFMSLTVDQILAGFLQAEWIITESGAIVAGNPDGARVEIRHDGVRVYVVGPNGAPYEAVSMVNGDISFAVIGQDGTRLGGISSTGAVSGTTGTFSKDVKVQGTPLLGQVGGGTIPGWLDNLPRGVIARNYKSTSETSIVTGLERAYLRANATLYPGRQYRIRSTMRANLSASGGALTLALRWSTDGPASLSSSQLPNTTTFSFPNASTNHRIVGWAEGFLEVDVVTKARFLLTYKGDYGATPAASSTYLYVEDVGPTTPVSGGDEEGPDTTLYRTTWRATATRRYYKSGEAMPSEEDGKVELWYWGGVPTDFKNVGILWGGGAVEATDSIEMGKTHAQALNGATIHKSEIYVKNKIWLGGYDEGYLALSSLSGTSLGDWETIDSTFWGGAVEAGEGVWVEVPTSWFTNGANRGIFIGDKDGKALNGSGVLTDLRSGVFHGLDDTEPPLIRHTYSR